MKWNVWPTRNIFFILQTIKKAAMRIPFENISNKVRDIYSKVSNRGNALFGFYFIFHYFIFWNSEFTMIFLHTFGISVFSQPLFLYHFYSVIMSLDQYCLLILCCCSSPPSTTRPKHTTQYHSPPNQQTVLPLIITYHHLQLFCFQLEVLFCQSVIGSDFSFLILGPLVLQKSGAR